MSDRLVILPQQPITSASQPQGQKKQGGKIPSISFDSLLHSKLQQSGTVKFSRHAESRMATRGINFNGAELDRLNQAVAMAEAKGARDSLVLLGECALVVSVKNNTVVTVVDRENLANNVFTNIDSAVIA